MFHFVGFFIWSPADNRTNRAYLYWNANSKMDAKKVSHCLWGPVVNTFAYLQTPCRLKSEELFLPQSIFIKRIIWELIHSVRNMITSVVMLQKIELGWGMQICLSCPVRRDLKSGHWHRVVFFLNFQPSNFFHNIFHLKSWFDYYSKLLKVQSLNLIASFRIFIVQNTCWIDLCSNCILYLMETCFCYDSLA